MEIDQHQLYSEDKILAIRTDGGLKAYLVDRVSHESQIPNMIESGLCSELTPRQKTRTGKIDLITWSTGQETIVAAFSSRYAEDYAFTVVIWYNNLLTFAKGTVEGWVVDKQDHTGAHIQEQVKTDAKEWLRENIGEAIKEFLETGNQYYQL